MIGPADRAPLLGNNLVRLIYLDEAGTDRANAPYLCVAGVIIHGDLQWPEVDRRIEALVDKYVRQNAAMASHFTLPTSITALKSLIGGIPNGRTGRSAIKCFGN